MKKMCSLKPFHQSRREVNEVKLMAADGTRSCKLVKKIQLQITLLVVVLMRKIFISILMLEESPRGVEVDIFRIFMFGNGGWEDIFWLGWVILLPRWQILWSIYRDDHIFCVNFYWEDIFFCKRSSEVTLRILTTEITNFVIK